MLTGKVLITGGSGFLARAIYRRAAREHWPCTFTALGRHEDSMTQLHRAHPHIRCVLGDIRNLSRLIDIAQGHDVIIHGAALKRVPESEENVVETVEINVGGSLNVAMAAHAAHVNTVIGVSTDKAASPLNLYGATKMVMERIFGEADTWGETRFVVTRYGNVVGSTGSIVPVFIDQLERDGYVSVTDPEMTRFWLAPDEAVDLILDCAPLDEDFADIRGSILIPLPAAMKIGGLARTLVDEWVQRSGPVQYPAERYGDYIRIIGPRPGEKKHEALLNEYEAARSQFWPTSHGTRLRLYPSAGGFVKDRLTDGPLAYTSDAPASWIESEAMAAMITDALTV